MPPSLLYRRFPNRLRVGRPTPGRFGNRRYSRLGGLRYGSASLNWCVRSPQPLRIEISPASRQFFHFNMPVFHLPAVAFQADRPGRRDFEGGFHDLAVASAKGFRAFDGDFDLIPILRLVPLEVLV